MTREPQIPENVTMTPCLQTAKPLPRLRDYLSLARFDHATKHVFIIPGLILAYALREPSLAEAPARIGIGLLSAVAIASANYIINEWLDRESDAHHPVKYRRTAVSMQLAPELVYIQYALFGIVGLLLAALLGSAYFALSLAFLISGLVYNVQPVRSKDRPFLDVISESINNPIRLGLGWLMMDPTSIPPASLLLAYWTGGAFLMGSKRLSEYRDITASVGAETLQRYRKSFAGYTAESLIVSCLVYAMLSSFFLGVFLIKYRIEYVLAFPFIAMLFGCYIWLSMLPHSIAQRPERSFRSRRLMVSLAVAVGALAVFSFVDLPGLKQLSNRDFTPADMIKATQR